MERERVGKLHLGTAGVGLVLAILTSRRKAIYHGFFPMSISMHRAHPAHSTKSSTLYGALNIFIAYLDS